MVTIFQYAIDLYRLNIEVIGVEHSIAFNRTLESGGMASSHKQAIFGQGRCRVSFGFYFGYSDIATEIQ